MHRRQLPILAPCTEDFAAMPPTGATHRHCERCQTPVHDLSAMTRAEARLLLLRSLGQSLCVRYRTDTKGQLHFRPPPPRPTGPLVTALAGLMAACTSTAPAVDAPALPELDWTEPSPTIPGWDHPSTVEPGVEQGVIGGVVGGISGVTMGAMVPTLSCTGYPVHEDLLEAPAVRVRDHHARNHEHHPRSRTRAQRRAERKQRRRLRRREQEARRAAQRAERTIQREIREAEREVERQTRRAERKRRRLARRARRRHQRAARAEARRLRREARRAARRARRDDAPAG